MGGWWGIRTAEDDDPLTRIMDQHYDQRAVFRQRIEALRAEGVSYERAVDAVVGPVGSHARAWWDA